MELIFEILKKLKNYELRQIRNYLNASPFDFEKVGTLFELVTRYKDKDEDFFSQKLYGAAPDNTFRVTKSRLKKLLEDVVLNEKSLTDYSAEHINASLQSKKRLLQGEILLGRGAYLSSKNLLLQVIATSKKFSLHNEEYWSGMLLHRNQSINMSVREFQKRTTELLRLNEINYRVNEAAILHYSVTNVLTQRSLKEDEFEEIDVRIQRIEQVAKETGSPLARYYFLLSRVMFLQYTYRYAEAVTYGEEYLALVQSEPAVQSKQRQGSAMFQLTESYLRKGDLLLAEKNAREMLELFSKEETNYLIVLGTAFQIAFFLEKWDEAAALVQSAFSHPRLNASAFRAASWHYFNSCVLLRTGKTSEALRALNDATPLLTDKMGWNLTFRLHEIIVLYEAGLYDLLETKIQNMRQFVKRTQRNSELYRPMKLIQILMEWHRNSLDIKKTLVSAQKYLQELRDFHKTIPFDPSSGELIRFEAWLEAKKK
jgi:tetratricopeptide (TPR) repeat protein